jgi:hypothetical protein
VVESTFDSQHTGHRVHIFILALALVHHLAIANNLPFANISALLGQICEHLIIEFVPKTDSQVKRLLSTREDIFPGYTQQEFEREFQETFTIEKSSPIPESERVLYRMRRKGTNHGVESRSWK